VPGSATTHEHVQRMLEQIQGSYTQRLTLGTLARTLGMQSAYLGRLFREEVGVTVHEYVTRARMANGAAQVRSGVKIEAVALDLGYRSKKNFYRQFKRRFGMTPEAYRHGDHDAAVSEPVPPQPSRDVQRGQTGPSDSSMFLGGPAELKRAAGRSKDRPSPLSLLAPQTMMRTLVASRIAMLVTDGAGCYVGANETAVSMTGYSIHELRGKPVEVLFPYMSGSDTRCRLQILLPASSFLPTNTVLRTKSAGPVRVHLTSAENLLGDRLRMISAL
jgi:PAS domain S-box-containing protein